ncbi:hypothetical protein BRADI_4g41480v3 [Brachypodium distachyon]|uniref:DUF6598 domain-containing protein n=1 Tax=Brachypodium distachyon TaxID=15368 RepID=A0A0Q3HUX2_BRADI|nr:hypothetical protein BRADI_4g41480v3 [Brachypodium distachyon]
MAEAELCGDSLGHKRADPEGAANGGDAKRPHEDGNGLPSSSMEKIETEVEEDDDYQEENPLDIYRQIWTERFGRLGISFEDESTYVLYVKVTQITDALQWPLDVYGVIALRDSIDHKRDFLFRRTRDQCQTLASLQDAELEITGPSRAVLLIDPHAFEIDLKVRGNGSPSEDKALSYYAFIYEHIAHMDKMVPTEHSTIEVRFAHLARTLESTIKVIVISGSCDFSARFTARTASIDEDMVLLDSRGGKVDVSEEGEAVLKRRIVTVEERGKLILDVEAAPCDAEKSSSGGGIVLKRRIKLTPMTALRNEGGFDLGFSRLRVIVAWSMLP